MIFEFEHLPCHLAGLVQNDAPVLRVGVVAEVGPLVDEAPPLAVDHDAPGIGVLLEIVADGQVAELRRVEVPADGVAARPVAAGAGAGIDGHADAVAGVESGAAYLGKIPARPEIARAPFRVGLEAAGRQHDRAGAHVECLSLLPDLDAAHDTVVREQFHGSGAIKDLDAFALCRRVQRLDETRAAAPCLQHEAAPEFEPTVDLEGLLAVDRQELDALLAHPEHRLARAAHQRLAHVRVGPVLGDAPHVIEELIFGVGAEVGDGSLFLREVGH